MKIDQILKWIATSTLILGTVVNSLGHYPEGPLILAAGGYVWLVVSIMWRDWALITTNFVMSTTALVLVAYTQLFS
jgi:hypothetical protein